MTTEQLDYDTLYEYDADNEMTGDKLGFDLPGHGYDELAVDVFLAQLGDDLWPYDWREDDLGDYDEETAPQCFEVQPLWRTTGPDGEYEWFTQPVDGSVPVTRLWLARITLHWCINHPDEPGLVGIPAGSLLDADEVIAEAVAHLDPVDPKPQVDVTGNVAYVWMCRDCHRAFDQRLEAARKRSWMIFQAARTGAQHAAAMA